MNEAQVKDLLKRAYDRISKLEEQLAQQKAESVQDIAIVGISLRFPQVNSLEDLHLFLESGKSGVIESPNNRWKSDTWLGNKGEKGKAYTFAGGYLDNIEQFDHHFFNVPTEEAGFTDPQQRILLELAVEAVQNAGILLQDINGSSTSVFVGTVNSDFDDLISKVPTEYSPTGSIVASAAGKVAYKLNLKGPVMSLDTACSSSLTAIHMARQSLLNNECDYALAGGVSLMLTPKGHIGFSQLEVIATHGRCKTFSNDATGFGRGEGGGFVFLRRVADAVKDGNRILAIIKGSAVNHDGQSNGYTAPNQKAQEAVIASALQKAGVSPMEIGYIEAHGTGTSLGDAIELQALHTIFQYASEVQVGSIKANFGHTEYAAGIASIGKALLCLRKKRIYPQTEIDELNQNFNWDGSSLKVNRGQALENRDLKYVGVSGFGISGTNVHTILGNAQEAQINDIRQDYEPLALFCSARTRSALIELLELHLRRLEDMKEEIISSYLMANSKYRDHFEYRIFVAGYDKDSLLEGIRSKLRQETDIPLLVSPLSAGKIAFLFPGQGGQWAGMGKELYANSSYFRSVFDEVSREFEDILGLSVSENIVNSSEILLSNEIYLQPALFALQVSLAKLWMFYGYRPESVTGISMGEVSAAYIAGSLNLRDAAKIISLRTKYLVQYAKGVRFCLVELGLPQLEDLIRKFPAVEIAGVYSDNSSLIALDTGTLDIVQKELDDLGVYYRIAETTVASHCSVVEVFSDIFEREIADIEFKSTNLRIFSTAYGRWLKPGDYKPGYWKDNLRNPFQFHQAREGLLQQGYSVFIELSANPITSYYFLKGKQSNVHLFQPSLYRGLDSWDSYIQSVNTLYQKGVNPAVGTGNPAFIDYLPLYPWDRHYFEIPYDNYGHIEDTPSTSIEYMLPDWKPVQEDRSKRQDLGKIFLTGFQEQRFFDGQLYERPDDLLLKLSQNPETPSTIILDLHGLAGLEEMEAVINCIQALNRVKHSKLNLIFLVTNSIRVSGQEKKINEVGYGWLGFSRALKTEWEKGAVQWVDADNADYDSLIDFLSSDSSFDPFCIRGSGKYKLHLRMEFINGGGRRNPASALIIGGTSEMGLLMAQEYVRLGARHLVLHGKRPVQPEGSATDSKRDRLVRNEVSKWESEGVKVICTSGDIRSSSTVETILGVLHDNNFTLDDFVVAAGTSEYFNLLEHNPAEFTQHVNLRSFAWRPVVEMTKPDRVIFISSASSFFNSPGQGTYFFGNHVLDSWSSNRADRKQAVFSILFPLWSDIGKAKEQGFLPETLLEHASSHDLVRHFRHLVSVVNPPPVVIAANPANNNTRSLWKTVPFIPEGKLKHKIKEILTSSVNPAGQKDGHAEIDEINQFVAELWHDLLGERELLNHHHFFQLGGNSVMLVKLSNRLREKFPDIDLNVRDLIQNLTFQEQIDLIRSRVNESGKTKEFELTRAETRGTYLASEEQKQIWIQNQLEENNALYNLTGAYFYTGNLNVVAFKKAVIRISEEQEIFRTRYFLEDGIIYQKIDKHVMLNISETGVDNSDELEVTVKDLFQAESSYCFDLEEEHPFRVFILRSGNRGAFILNLHHIAADGWALGFYTKRLNDLYTQFSSNIEPEKRIPDLQYKDYCVHQQEKYLPGERGRRDGQFWTEIINTCKAENYLIRDLKRPAIYSYSGEKMTRFLPTSLFSQIEIVKGEAQVSLFSFLQASLSLLLCIKSGKKAIVTGTPFSSRIDKRLEEVVGNFVNLLPIHIIIEESDTVINYLSKVQQHLSKVIQHQSYPFNLMVQKSGLERDPSRHPIFDILFVLQNHEEASFELNGLEIKRKFIDPEHSKLDLFIELRESNGSLEFNFEFNDLIFVREIIEDFFREWENLLEYLCNRQDVTIADVIIRFGVHKELNFSLL